jgi:predicted metal-dependent RNase
VEEVLFELKRKVQSKLPPDINVTGLEFEGPELVIYTDDPKRLADDGEIIGHWPRSCASAWWSGRI